MDGHTVLGVNQREILKSYKNQTQLSGRYEEDLEEVIVV